MPLSPQACWVHQNERYSFATQETIGEIADMLGDPEVGRWLWFTPAPAEMFQGFFRPLIDAQLAQLETGTTPHTAVFRIGDSGDQFLGQGAVVEVDGSPGGFEIGFQLARGSWGRGVGTRLAQFCAAYAIHLCAAYRIEAVCLEGNRGSRAILEKLGLALEGKRPGYRLRDGVRHTELLYGARVEELDSEAIGRVADEVGLTA